MRHAHPMIRYLAPLLALAATAGPLNPARTRAQDNAGLSSGSGVGTGTGTSSVPDYRPPTPLGDPAGPGGQAVEQPPDIESTPPLGPGINVRFPDDTSIAPFLMQSESARTGTLPGGLRITPEMIDSAKLISEPGERGRILLQIARGAILGNQLVLAHRAVEEAATAATQESNDLIHDQLIISIVTTAGLLSDALLREAKPQLRLFPDEGDTRAPARMDGDLAIRTARLEWRRAAHMAAQIRNPTYRSEYLDRAVENMAVGSAIVALEYTSAPDDRGPKMSDEDRAVYTRQADDILEEGARIAESIERPIWRNRAMERLATAAGESGQYERATDLANQIKNAEARARALVMVAEFQARKGRNDDATRSYNLAAEAVASVQQRGLRGVLTGILIDSLISTGRFEDARISLALYPSDSERFVAMGAIAESLGLRRMPDEARAWINSDVPAEYRSTLQRRLNNGLLRAISEARAREFQGREFSNATRTE